MGPKAFDARRGREPGQGNKMEGRAATPLKALLQCTATLATVQKPRSWFCPKNI